MNKKATSKDYKFPEKCLKDLKDFLKKNSSLFEIQKKNFVDVINKCKRRDDKAKANILLSYANYRQVQDMFVLLKKTKSLNQM